MCFAQGSVKQPSDCACKNKLTGVTQRSTQKDLSSPRQTLYGYSCALDENVGTLTVFGNGSVWETRE